MYVFYFTNVVHGFLHCMKYILAIFSSYAADDSTETIWKDKSNLKVLVVFNPFTRTEVGPAVGRLRKIHKKVPDHVVHTVKLGRLINICGHLNDIIKQLCK